MKAEDLYITSSVVVRSKRAVHNGIVFFEKKDGDALSFVKELYKELKCDYSKFYKMDNLCKLAFAATELLLLNRTINCPKEEVALVFSNAGSSLDTDKTYYASVEDKSNYFPSPAVFVYTLPNIMMGEICIRHQFQGENAFFIAEKFDADLLVDYSANLLTSGKAKCVIAGWVEINENGWDAALFLIEKTAKENSGTRLSKESLNEIYALKKD
ncbi:MAG: 3-oxoacyl-ACP synthase [Bacteroidetes bacterium]|nr:3-oxoacyl-ACP synthase [Bacteroidota bacterium]